MSQRVNRQWRLQERPAAEARLFRGESFGKQLLEIAAAGAS